VQAEKRAERQYNPPGFNTNTVQSAIVRVGEWCPSSVKSADDLGAAWFQRDLDARLPIVVVGGEDARVC
jgi:hypothetical protein